MADTRSGLRTLGGLGWLAALALAAGCATLDRDECLTADWRTLGYQDGARGKLATEIGRYREDCAEHGVAPDLDAYNSGRAQGLGEYCRPQNGFSLGKRGRSYNGVCPAGLDRAFSAAYRAGREIYDLGRQIRAREQRLETARATLDELEREQAEVEAELIADGVSSKRRAVLLQRTRELDGEIEAARRDAQSLERNLTSERARLQRLERASPYL